jgi:hypothetical protein
VRTRTLLLLAVACGAAILAAGVVLLWRIGQEDDTVAPSTVGEAVAIGDLTVVVERYDESGDDAFVTIEIGGVEDSDAAAGFRLVVPERALAPDRVRRPAGRPPPCGAATETPARCTLPFDLAGVEGSSRVLVYRRGDQQVSWDLTG